MKFGFSNVCQTPFRQFNPTNSKYYSYSISNFMPKKTTSVMENPIPNGVPIKYLSQRNNKKSHALSQTAVQPLCPEIANSRTVCFRKMEVWNVEKYMDMS